MCNIVNTRLLRPFSVITEITTKSPQKLYNRSFFGPFFAQKSFFFPIEKFLTSSPQNKISFLQALKTWKESVATYIALDSLELNAALFLDQY